MNLYVGNLPYNITEEELRETFESHGKVTSVSVIKDKVSGRSRGFGFVEMADATEAKAAIEALNNKPVKGRTLTVNEARPRGERKDFGGRGGRGERRDDSDRY